MYHSVDDKGGPGGGSYARAKCETHDYWFPTGKSVGFDDTCPEGEELMKEPNPKFWKGVLTGLAISIPIWCLFLFLLMAFLGGKI
jgi:hypothetical protein